MVPSANFPTQETYTRVIHLNGDNVKARHQQIHPQISMGLSLLIITLAITMFPRFALASSGTSVSGTVNGTVNGTFGASQVATSNQNLTPFSRATRMQREANYFANLNEDIAWFEAAEKPLPAGDTRAIFLRVYHSVTLEMDTMFAEKQFHHPEWVNELMLKYVSLYKNAFDCDDQKNCAVSPAWQTAFRQNRRGKISPAGQLLLSISAHVNRDLPIALASLATGQAGAGSAVSGAVSGRYAAQFADPTYHDDFDKISLIFQRRMPALIQIVQDYQTCRINPLDRKIVDGVINFAINTTREKSWNWALKLANAKSDGEEQAVLAGIEHHAQKEDLSIDIFSPAPAYAICL